MKLVLQVQLLPDADSAAKLSATMSRFNEAANWLAGVAFERRCSNKLDLQRLAYRDLRNQFGLSSQTAILVVRRDCEAYKRDKSIQPEFRDDAAITYDPQTISFKGDASTSILTLGGRIVVPMVMGEHQREQLALPKGQLDLMRRHDGRWFLAITVDAPEPKPVEPQGFIGVDMGVVNLATDSDGETFKGDGVEACRQKYARIRKTCQRTGTKRAKRKLQKIRKKEARYRKDQNHCIAKKVVAKAKDTNSAIAVEELAGIGERTTVRKPERNRMKGWAFYQLRQFITYKALLAGIPVIPVDPRNTSRTCSECGHCEKGNRRSRDEFECRHCGFALPADVNAAKNIRSKAERYWVEVMQPHVGVDDAGPRNPAETTGKPVSASPSL
jgi:IS605 OrfB family transposase